MDNRKHAIHYRGHFKPIYHPVSVWQRLYAAFTPFILILAFFLLLKIFSIFPFLPANTITPINAALALLATFGRLLAAYFFSLVFSIFLALFVEKSRLIEHIFLPFFDIFQSVPVLAFFPLIILIFVKSGAFNSAAIFIFFLTMIWSIVFSLIGGLKVIPEDIKAAAQVFDIRGFSYLRKIILPAIFPSLVTGSILAWAQGWNIIIVAEVLHTYIPGGTVAQDLFGIGSLIVHASASGQNGTFVVAILVMVGVIGLLNFFIWQKLLHYAERFRFE